MTELAQPPLSEEADQHPKPANNQQPDPRIFRRVGEGEFIGIEPSVLRFLFVLVQALDNQWMPRSLWQKMAQKGQLTESIEKRRQKQVRAEYIRALVNSQRTVLNRAYIYNSEAVFQDYLQEDEQCAAFKALLQEGIIIPYLLGESGPSVQPSSGPETVGSYGVVAKSQKRWREICQDVRMQCVRLSWDDELNKNYVRQQLAMRFNQFAMSAAAGDIDTYIRDLSLDASAKASLLKRLADVGHFCLDIRSQGRLVTRNDLYKAFVTAGDNPADRMYDVSKPFAGEIKQLIDLAYNCNLPDALGGYLITPIDSLPRTALQEWQKATKEKEITGDELITLLRRLVLDLVMRGSYLKSMDLLTLQDVREIRRMDEWETYIGSVENLLEYPFQFADGGAAAVHMSYVELAKRMTRIVEQRYAGRKEKATASWEPGIELVVNIAGAVLSVLLTPASAGPIYQVSGQVSTLVAAAAAPVVVRLAIKGVAKVRGQADLSTSIDFMKGTMNDAQRQWEEMKRQMRDVPGFQDLQTSAMSATQGKDAILNYQDQVTYD
jgi:hypothetical protein